MSIDQDIAILMVATMTLGLVVLTLDMIIMTLDTAILETIIAFRF